MGWRVADRSNSRIRRRVGFSGLATSAVFGGFGGAPFSLLLSGLSTDSLGPYGQIGNHASIGFTSTCVPATGLGSMQIGSTFEVL